MGVTRPSLVIGLCSSQITDARVERYTGAPIFEMVYFRVDVEINNQLGDMAALWPALLLQTGVPNSSVSPSLLFSLWCLRLSKLRISYLSR